MNDTVARLRKMADEIESVGYKVKSDGMTIKEAYAIIAERFPTMSIEIEVSRYKHSGGPSVEFTVYDGNTHHKSGTLAGAVRMAMDTLAEGTIEDADAALNDGESNGVKVVATAS